VYVTQSIQENLERSEEELKSKYFVADRTTGDTSAAVSVFIARTASHQCATVRTHPGYRSKTSMTCIMERISGPYIWGQLEIGLYYQRNNNWQVKYF